MFSLKQLWWTAFAAGLVAAAITAVAAPARAEEPAANHLAEIAPDTFAAAMEQYLLDNPKLLERLNDQMSEVLYREQVALHSRLISENATALFEAEDAVVIGNPDGDVTLVEFYDYNCSYCRSAAPDLVGLIEANPNLRVVLMDLPILSDGSVAAAEIGLAFAQQGGDVQSFHEAMWTLPAPADADAAIKIAESLDADIPDLLERAASDELRAALQRRIDLAQTMQISGTPSFIIGDTIVPGVAGQAALQAFIDNVEACGSASCG